MDAGMNVFVFENLENAEANYRPNRHRNPRNPIEELNEEQFVKMFRLSKDLFRYLMNRLEPLMRPQSRNSDLDIQSKILAALSFFANGSYQTNVGNNAYIDVSQASVCVSLREVVAALNEPAIYNEWVQFPENFNGPNRIRQGFVDQHGFPGVVGCIDCTHVAIVPPPGKDEAHPEHLYVNRKSYHSINVQLICDAQLRILNVNARFPGSTNDAYIWNQSAVQALLRNIHGRGERDYFLLGNSGYPLRTWLLSPFTDAVDGTPEAYYNHIHKNARAVVERCNGVLKARFRCLLKHRVLHYCPESACKIIIACIVLHNMCIYYNVPFPDEEVDNDLGLIIGDIPELNAIGRGDRINPELLEGRQARNRLVHYLNTRRATDLEAMRVLCCGDK